LLTDRNGLVGACRIPVAGNYHDVYQIQEQTDRLFINADAGFNADTVQKTFEIEEIILNVAPNRRTNSFQNSDEFFDKLMYQESVSVERTNA
jgi:hypothetical protein